MKKVMWVLFAAMGYALLTNNKPKEVKIVESIVLVEVNPPQLMSTYSFMAPAPSMVQ